jgi:hypothetical protein
LNSDIPAPVTVTSGRASSALAPGKVKLEPVTPNLARHSTVTFGGVLPALEITTAETSDESTRLSITALISPTAIVAIRFETVIP